MFNGIIQRFQNSDERSQKAIVNSAVSLVAKGIQILSTLLIIPLTINYVNPSRYGIWLTLSSIIAWFSFLDLGLGNGMRNKFAEAKAKNDEELCQQYVSTTYFTVAFIALFSFCLFFFINAFINWTSLLHVDTEYQSELQKVFLILCGFTCLNLVANLSCTLLTADQRPGLAAILQSAGQLVSLAIIFILTKITTGNLVNLAIYFAGAPCLLLVAATGIMFINKQYRTYAPKIKNFRISHIKSILSLGGQFFIIYLCMVAVFQIQNLILTREVGPEAVTQYNIVTRYFNIVYMVITTIVTPLWTATTDAFTRGDYKWVKSCIHSLEKIYLAAVVVMIIMYLIAPWVFHIWIGDSVQIPTELVIGVLIHNCFMCLGTIYMYIINGIGKIRLQLIIYIIFAIVSWHLLTISCQKYSVVGIVIVPTILYLTQATLIKIQLHKVLTHSAKGLWNK